VTGLRGSAASARQARLRRSAASARQARVRGSAASARQARVRGSAASAQQAGERGSGAEAGGLRHFVTDRRRFGLSIDELVARAAAAVRAGVDVVQVREGDLPDRELAALVRQIVSAAAGTATRVLVNDRADIAIVAGAAGVHLRGDSAPASRVRAMTPAGFLIGRSVHTLAEVDAAAGGGLDYLLFGTVFPSEGKPEGHPVAGLEALRQACARSSVPVIAIGGMTEARAAAVRVAGAAGFAAVGLYTRLTPLPEVV
jgi:thiamine-phosphate pyrophosphorylase